MAAPSPTLRTLLQDWLPCAIAGASMELRFRCEPHPPDAQTKLKEMFPKGLTKTIWVCFICIDEAKDDPQCPRQTRFRTPLHYPDPPRLLAPPPHPPSLR